MAVLGPGLIGGSLARAVKHFTPAVSVRVWGRRAEAVERLAAEREVVDFASTDTAEVVAGADLVVLAMPTGSMAEVVASLPGFSSASGQPVLVTDVGSVKAPVVDQIAPLVAAKGGRFIGSHPMAGSERTGWEHGEATLFEGASVIVTPQESEGTSDVLLSRLTDFWQSLGGVVSFMSAAQHDKTVASISHLPHLLAAALTRRVLSGESTLSRYCGGGFRDTTRIAAGPEEMWSGIFADNREALSAELAGLMAELQTWQAHLESGDREALSQALREARHLRQAVS